MTPTDTPAPPATDDPPDAAADLTCPLCGYSLRGLQTPRCPECGFAFAWAELLDDRRTRHPWLFEHARRGRLVRAFLSTYVRSYAPWHFWRRVTPANPVHPGRLVVYWLIACLPMFAVAAPVEPVYVLARDNLAVRAYLLPMVNGQPRGPQPVNVDGRYYSGPAYGVMPRTPTEVDALFPAPWSPAFAVQAWNAIFRDPTGGVGFGRRTGGLGGIAGGAALTAPVVTAFAVTVGWPWLSLACLSVFQWSMRRASVRPAHVLRAAVYGCDFGLPALAAVAAYHVLRQWPAAADWLDFQFRSPVYPPDAPLAVWIVLACAAAATVRLTIGYARYLRFHWPLATVLASQVMAVLIAVLILFHAVIRH